MNTIDILKQEEGFNGNQYTCTEGHKTIGYGTKLPLSKYEADMLLKYRFDLIKKEVEAELSFLEIEQDAWDVLYLMAYQLGVAGVMKFHKMIEALRKQDYKEASRQMLDSRWKLQTPARAKRMAKIMEDIG